MSSRDRKDRQVSESEDYDLMVELEQLESLREEMEEMGVTTLEEVERRITDLHQRLDMSEDR